MDEGRTEEKHIAMDVSMDGDNLQLTQQVTESRVVLSALRNTFTAMLSAKEKDPALSSGTLAQIAKLRTRAQLLFLELKQLNRTVTFLGQTMKGGVQAKKVSQTQVNLDLQGLLYERSHFVKEINKCQDFKPAADDISLVSTQEFYALTNSPPISDKHALMVARLRHEIKSRQQLLVDLDAKRGRKAQYELSLAKQRDTAQDIRKHMAGVLGSVSSLASQLPGQTLSVPISSSQASLLPKPLYTLYNILCCQQTYYQTGFNVKISQESKDDSKCNSNSGMDEETTKPANLLITPHDVTVILTITTLPCGLSNNDVILLFRYLLPVGVVSVSVSGPGSWPNMLTNLYPHDDGDCLPTNVSALGVAPIRIDHGRFGTPFRWLQELCGLHFNHPIQSLTYLRSLDVSTFFVELQRRVKMRASFRRQFHTVKQKVVPSFADNALDDFPLQPTRFHVSEWASCPPESFFQRKRSSNIEVEGEETTLEWFQTGAEYFQFVVHEGKNNVALEGVVEIASDYPTHPPSFCLSSHKDASEIEAEVNHYFPKTLRQIAEGEEKGEMSLISHQLKKILVCCQLKSRSAAALSECLRNDQSIFI